MTRRELIERIDRTWLSDPVAVKSLIRDAVRLRVCEDEGALLGSRLGGRPALPASTEWPKHEGRSLAFIAQIDLASLPSLGDDNLPNEGRLLFFYDVERTPWGFDPKDRGGFATIHVAPSADVSATRDWPLDVPPEARYPSRRLAAEVTATLPPWESVLVEDLELKPEQMDRYQELLETVSESEDWATCALLGGHPDQIQGDMTLQCALVAAGRYCGDANAYQDPRLPTFRRDARDWRLLLQVPSAESIGMMWGDAGCLYYWIRDEDLRAGQLKNAWLILQCG